MAERNERGKKGTAAGDLFFSVSLADISAAGQHAPPMTRKAS
jgi:hypothetical protein